MNTKLPEQYYAYVPHSRVDAYVEIGWEFESELPPPHCFYACLYRWIGEGEPLMPKRTDQKE
jgi:hypothetical protein